MSFAHSRRVALSNDAMSTRQGRVLCPRGTRATAIVTTYCARARAQALRGARMNTNNFARTGSTACARVRECATSL